MVRWYGKPIYFGMGGLRRKCHFMAVRISGLSESYVVPEQFCVMLDNVMSYLSCISEHHSWFYSWIHPITKKAFLTPCETIGAVELCGLTEVHAIVCAPTLESSALFLQTVWSERASERMANKIAKIIRKEKSVSHYASLFTEQEMELRAAWLTVNSNMRIIKEDNSDGSE